MLSKKEFEKIDEALRKIMYYRPNVSHPVRAEYQEQAVDAIKEILKAHRPVEKETVRNIEWYVTKYDANGSHAGGEWKSQEVPVAEVAGFVMGLIARHDVLQVQKGKTFERFKQ